MERRRDEVRRSRALRELDVDCFHVKFGTSFPKDVVGRLTVAADRDVGLIQVVGDLEPQVVCQVEVEALPFAEGTVVWPQFRERLLEAVGYPDPIESDAPRAPGAVGHGAGHIPLEELNLFTIRGIGEDLRNDTLYPLKSSTKFLLIHLIRAYPIGPAPRISIRG